MKGISLERSCEVLSLCERRMRRWRKVRPGCQPACHCMVVGRPACHGLAVGRRSGNRYPPNAMTEEEKDWVKRACEAKELADYSLRALSFHLLEEERE